MSQKANEPPRKCLGRNVYIIGPQSTGKTTLVNAMAQSLEGDVHVIQEIARTVMRERGYSRNDVDSDNSERRFTLQQDIFNAQVEKEMMFLQSGKEFLSDRSAVDPLIYLMHFSGQNEVNRITSTDKWRKVRSRYADYNQSLVVLLSPVASFLVDDDVRYMSKSLDDWNALASNFRLFLDQEKIPFVEIGEEILDIKERVTEVMQNLEKKRTREIV
jgi:nicotinamide riboside kinase